VIFKVGLKKYMLAMATLALSIVLIIGGFTLFLIRSEEVQIRSAFASVIDKGQKNAEIFDLIATYHTNFSAIVSESDVDTLEQKHNQSVALGDSISKNLAECGGSCSDIQPIFEELKQAFTKAIGEFLQNGHRDLAIKEGAQKLDPIYQKVLTVLKVRQTAAGEESNQHLTNSEKSLAQIFTVVLAMSVIFIFLFSAFALILSRSLVGFLSKQSSQLTDNMTTLLEHSHSIQALSASLSQGVSNQDSYLQSTLSALEEVEVTNKKTSELAESGQLRSQAANKDVLSAKASSEDMSQTMTAVERANNDLNDSVKSSNKEILDITKLMTEISAKTKIIHDIVFQTRLLSFNASVEAARAGEHGKGFAVVAQEIGNLAQMSGRAAQEIGDLLQRSQQTVEMTVTSSSQKMEQMLGSVREIIERGKDCAETSLETIQRAQEKSAEVEGCVIGIASASGEQAKGSELISKSLRELDTIGKNNSSVSRNLLGSAGKLSEMSLELEESIDQLKALIGLKETADPQDADEAA